MQQADAEAPDDARAPDASTPAVATIAVPTALGSDEPADAAPGTEVPAHTMGVSSHAAEPSSVSALPSSSKAATAVAAAAAEDQPGAPVGAFGTATASSGGYADDGGGDDDDDAFGGNTVVPVTPIRGNPALMVWVMDPEKHGDSFADQYVTYAIRTKTTLPEFESNELSVRRRFNDFLWLHERLVRDYPTYALRTVGSERRDRLRRRTRPCSLRIRASL